MRFSIIILICLLHLKKLECVRKNYGNSKPGNLLIFYPLYSGSHEYTLDRIGRAFKAQGYNVTKVKAVTTEPIISSAGINTIDVILNESFTEPWFVDEDGRFIVDKKMLWDLKRRFWEFPDQMYLPYFAFCHSILGDQTLIRTLRSMNFTIAIVDSVFNECGNALVKSLDVPIVGFWGCPMEGAQGIPVSGFKSPAVSPHLTSEVNDLTIFSQRLWNSITSFFGYGYMHYTFSKTNEIIQVRIKNIQFIFPAKQKMNAHYFLQKPK